MKRILLAIVCVFLCVGAVLAHPHTFITTRLDVEFAGDVIKGVWVEWEFDEMFSSSVLMDADLDRNGRFNAKETAIVFEDAFSNLKNYGYFFYMRKGNDRSSPPAVERFSVKKVKDKLVYRFFVPVKDIGSELIVSVFDPTFFCAVSYVPKSPVNFLHAEKVQPSYKIVKNDKFPIYYNPMGAADDQTVYLKWKKGLQTAYPEEVVVSFRKKA